MNDAVQGIEKAIAHSTGGAGSGNGVSHAALGMIIFVVCEIMFFGGLVSAYLVGSAGQDWPPTGQPRLPVWTTAFNTVVLLLSGWFM
ncbi:MAG: cytochrome c oxidase subunit 3, partial [Lentisphaeria bacterium]|nr:cytochrome c oxidase subunit 3 [Lentisphaeria bacterium]